MYNITNCYTVTGDVIPVAGYEKNAYFKFNACASVSEDDKDTTLTYGDDGYIVRGDKLMLAVFAPKLAKGDVDGDGVVNIGDVIRIIKQIF